MKLTKSSLKALIKECLVEVLQEGIDLSSPEPRVATSRNTGLRESRSKRKTTRRAKSPLDNIKFDNAVKETAKSFTDDPVMQSIFSDTAKTTLQEQLNASRSTPHVPAGADSATLKAAASDPLELFGGSNNWAALAFADDDTL